MDIEAVIKHLSELSSKKEDEISKSFEAEFERKDEEFKTIDIPRDQITQMAFIVVGKQLNISEADMSSIFIAVEIEEDFQSEANNKVNEVKIMDEKAPSKAKSFKDFVKGVEKTIPETNYKKRPSLIVQDGARYRMKLLDPSKIPFEYDNGEYTSYVFDIELISVEPAYMYDEVYEKGDKKGDKLYVNGEEYSLWLWEKPFWAFVDFWETLTDDDNPDDREFIYYKKSRGNVKDFIFKEV